MKSALCAAGIAALSLAGMNTVIAQPQAPAAPVLRDIPEKDTLPKDGVFELLGVRLGMTKDEAIARLAEQSKEAPTTNKTTVGIRDNRGNSFEFPYEPTVHASLKTPDGTQDDIELTLTTRINTERVMQIIRRIRYAPGRPGSASDLVADLNKKYGPPSYRTHGPHLPTTLYYAWHNGRRLSLSQQDVAARRYTRGAPERCMDARVVAYTFRHPYEFEGCTARMEVRIDLGQRDDLANYVEITLGDVARARQNTQDTDAWVVKELERVIGGQTGTRSKL